MANPLMTLARTYPVTLWAGVGIFSYAWKASLVSHWYDRTYVQWEQQRQQELKKASQ